jgi:cation transport ATPase
MATAAIIVHQLPGRVRLRLDEKRGDPEYFSALSENVSHLNGVEQVKVNPSTGSMVIEFSDSTENLVQQLQQQDLSVENQYEKNKPTSRPAPVNSGVGSTTPFHLVSNRDINPMFMLAAALAALGVVQTFRGKILVPSLSVLWYAMQAFRQSKASRAAVDDMEGG